DDAHGLDIDVMLTIEKINTREEAELNQELFAKLFGPDVVKSEKEVREINKTVAEKLIPLQADHVMLNNVVESLIENTKFDLPDEFLINWIQKGSEKELTAEEAKAEYERSEKGLRYQLIEGKLMTDNNLYATFEDLKEYTKS